MSPPTIEKTTEIIRVDAIFAFSPSGSIRSVMNAFKIPKNNIKNIEIILILKMITSDINNRILIMLKICKKET